MMTTELAVIESNELETIQRTGKMLAASGYFEGKGDSPQAIAMMATKIMAGREMGFGPFASVNGIHIIQGKPTVGANLMAAAVKGSARYDYRVREMTDKVCKIEFFEREGDKKTSIGISEFTAADATKAGTKNMDKFARNMLFARAMSNGVRWYCPDIFNGNAIYVPEEMGADLTADGDVIEGSWSVGSQQQLSTPPVSQKPAMTLAMLSATYTPSEIMAINGGKIPQTPEECSIVADKLANRKPAGTDLSLDVDMGGVMSNGSEK